MEDQKAKQQTEIGRSALSPIPLSEHTKTKLFLLWTKKITSLYLPLSANILREVCGYIAFRAVIAVYRKKCIETYDVSAASVRRFDFDCTAVPLSSIQDPSLTCVGDRQIFLSGGMCLSSSKNPVSKRTFLFSPGAVCELQRMLQERYKHQLYYDEASHSVFAFGGSSFSGVASHTAERFRLDSAHWSQLPDMQEKRIHFTVCGNRRKVYLCGGCFEKSEVFTIAAEEFSLLNWVDCTSPYVHFSVIWDERLFVMGQTSLFQWDLRTETFLKSTEIDIPKGHSIRQWHGLEGVNCFYMINNAASMCVCIDLATASVWAEIDINTS